MNLIKPEAFKDQPAEFFKKYSNGCGPKGLGWCVPDKFLLLGIDFTPACDIHDFCYIIGVPKKIADNMFWDNMVLIANECKWPISSVG